MFKCIAILQIHGNSSACSSDDRWLEKRFTLPFVPVVGMDIKLSTDLTLNLEHKKDRRVSGLVEIDWDNTKKQFRLWFEDSELYNNPGNRPIEEIVGEYKAEGWKLRNK